MNENLWSILSLAVLLISMGLIFAGAVKAGKANPFWATRLQIIGSSLLVIALTIFCLTALCTWLKTSDPSVARLGALMGALSILVGFPLYLIGLFGFCSRWGAMGKRRDELLEITAALSAARDQAQRESEAQVTTSTPSQS